MTEKEKLQELLEKLVQAIFSAIGEGLAEKTLQPHYMRYFRWKPTKFEERDNVTRVLGREGKEFLKPIWPTNDVVHKVCELDIYSDTYEAISEDYSLGEGKINEYLLKLITELAENILTHKVKNVADTTKHIDSFLRDINGEKQEYLVEVQLKALILQPKFIKLDDSVRLRKPERKDFEEETPIYYTLSSRERDPTAILNIKAHSNIETSYRTYRDEIDRAIAIFRLFRVGAVECLRYTTHTSSLLDTSGSVETALKLWWRQKYLITRKDVKSLKNFWANMKKVKLPDSVYSNSQQELDELSIAYERYIDSLEGRIIEKRVSSAVMGLEALFLGEEPKERGELRYKLRMRVSKILSLIGYNPNEAKDRIRDAYDIRSTYVHGSLISKKNRHKYEDSYGDLNEFSKTIMDYLRASIVALLKKPSKTALIQEIDNSFLDSKQEEKIKKLLFMPY